MRRSAGLIPLSRLHKTKLTYALHLRRASTDAAVITPARAWSAFVSFWDNHGVKHMEEEEKVLLPCLERWCARGVGTTEGAKLLRQHEAVIEMVGSLRAPGNPSEPETPDVASLRGLGELLTDHVRYEERVLFPLVQRVVPERELLRLKGKFSPPVACTIRTH